MALCYYGTVKVVAKIGAMAYKLALPTSSWIHHIFHLSCLKQKLGQQITPLPTLSPMYKKGVIQPKPKAILERTMKEMGNQALTEVLVKWTGTLAEDIIWESL